MPDNEPKPGGILGQPFPNPAEDTPSFEDGLEDLKRQQKEDAGTHPAPFMTLSFWLSLAASVLAYLAASQAFSDQVQDWVILLIALFAHFGYGVAADYFTKNPEGLNTSTPNWKRPAFYASFAAVLTSYALGSGHQEAAAVGGQVAVVLSYLGYGTRPWIRRKAMMDQESDKATLVQRVLEFLLFVTDRKKK